MQCEADLCKAVQSAVLGPGVEFVSTTGAILFPYTLQKLDTKTIIGYRTLFPRQWGRGRSLRGKNMLKLTHDDLRKNLPYDAPRKVQDEALGHIARSDHGVLLEVPTGEGKTGIGLAPLRALAAQGKGPLFVVTPTKTQVEQVRSIGGRRMLPVLGRAEYECLYYTGRGIPGVTAQQSPCYMLKCEHRVDQETGEVEERGAVPCPYFQAKFEARTQAAQGGIVVCTTAFFLTNRLLVSQWAKEDPALVVVDEVHRLAKTARGVFEYTMTDYHLRRVAALVHPLDPRQARIILKFRMTFMGIARRRLANSPALLKDAEVEKLLSILEELDAERILEKIFGAIGSGRIDPLRDKEELKLLENLARNIPRFVRSLRYALEQGDRKPLNYVVAFYERKDDPSFQGTSRKARYQLTIRNYYVVPLIRKALGPNVVAMSATIGDPKMVKFESGIDLPFHSFASSFSVARTRIFVPKDAHDLSMRGRRRNDLNRTLRRIVEMTKQFARSGYRSLVVVVSNAERVKFLQFAEEAKLRTVSYQSNGTTARQAAAAFVDGEGDALVGTAAQYGEGVDLPRGIAPIIFFLRPGYQRPDDPEIQFEERRFGQSTCWKLWRWRVMMESLQVRGRNIRTARDLGVCFFMSEQFRKFLYGSLPAWLQPAYRADLSSEAAVEETLTLLRG